MINKKNCIVTLKTNEKATPAFFNVDDIEGDKKNQPNSISQQLHEFIDSADCDFGNCDVEIKITGCASSMENISESHINFCKPKIQETCPYYFTPRQMQVCHYSFNQNWGGQQIANLFKTSISNIDGFKKGCFDECALVGKDRKMVNLGKIWLKYYSNWTDPEVHLP